MFLIVDNEVLECLSTNCMPLIADRIENDINSGEHPPHIKLEHNTTFGVDADGSRT